MCVCDDDNEVDDDNDNDDFDDDGWDDDDVVDTKARKLFRKLLFVTGARRKTLPVANPQISRWEGWV